jgi:2-isopropylmalate synthase
MRDVLVYDTTLRDGCQAEGVNLNVEDKLRVAQRLDAFGVAYIEGGWPNETNPQDREFFQRAQSIGWANAKIAAFGSTRRGGIAPEDDSNLQQLVASAAPVVTIFGKSWTMHATDILRVSIEENLRMIEDSVAYLKSHGREVIFDAEHFFDGYVDDPGFALECLLAAQRGGADGLALCDTNGGMLPLQVMDVVKAVLPQVSLPLGIHCHNDSGTAVANSIVAVQAGCQTVQGTMNGYGERAGNANLCTIIPDLQLKLGYRCLPEEKVQELQSVSWYVSEQANLPRDIRQPFVGSSAFAHKGGMHVNAVLKKPESFEHISPEAVGNERRILVSDDSGSSTIVHKLQKIWPDLKRDDPLVAHTLKQVKNLENSGYVFEGAEASFELLAKQLKDELPKLFDLRGFRVIVEKWEGADDVYSEATIRLRVNGDSEVMTSWAEGDGPVNALDNALRKVLREKFPQIERLKLTDYKVRVIDATQGTATAVRALIETTDGETEWGTVGAHENIIEASYQALVDSLVYGLLLHLGAVHGTDG